MPLNSIKHRSTLGYSNVRCSAESFIPAYTFSKTSARCAAVGQMKCSSRSLAVVRWELTPQDHFTPVTSAQDSVKSRLLAQCAAWQLAHVPLLFHRPTSSPAPQLLLLRPIKLCSFLLHNASLQAVSLGIL